MWADAQRDGRPAEYTVGGALCSTPQTLADAHCWSTVQQRCQDAKPVEISWCPKLPD